MAWRNDGEAEKGRCCYSWRPFRAVHPTRANNVTFECAPTGYLHDVMHMGCDGYSSRLVYSVLGRSRTSCSLALALSAVTELC